MMNDTNTTTKRTIRRRCADCGKLSNNKTGEYVRKGGSAGYIAFDEDAKRDLCTDCQELAAKSYYVLGQAEDSGVLIRCADKNAAEYELSRMRNSNCRKIARTIRPITEIEALAWFPVGLQIIKRQE